MKNILVLLLVVSSFLSARAQTWNYEVSLETISIPELGGIQSYAIGTSDGEWLVIGGRLDGLHQRQPFASFNSAGNNNQIIVVNPELGKVWKQSIDFLPPRLKEQLASTNMQFYQDEGMLLLTGGYAFSATQNDHVTFPYLTTLDVSSVILKVKNETLAASDFNQVEDDFFAVTGGRMGKIDQTYYLVGGHKFMGRYNPMGPNNGPGFIQEYTDAVRKFQLEFDPDLKISSRSTIIDPTHLHRRDYNLVPHVINDSRILMLYSGVFKKTENLPFLYPVAIDTDTIDAITTFQQKFNHYHCANLPIYHAESQEMHTLFFGGIAQFYMEDGLLVQDNDVPFVNTIADVARLSDGRLIESKNETELPGFLGAGSEFIISPEVNLYEDEILDGDSFSEEQTVGYIFGGIRSSLPNIFFINTGSESEASGTIYKVKLRKVQTSASTDIEMDRELNLEIYPNPAQRFIRVLFSLEEPLPIDVNIFDIAGKKVHNQQVSKSKLQSGQNYLILNKVNIEYGTYFYEFRIGNKTITRKVIWSE